MKIYTNTHKQLLIKLLYTLLLSISFSPVSAQLISSDQAPPSVKWEQINEPSFNLIYPTELRDLAEQTAIVLKTNIRSISHTLGIKPRKINIILQNRTLEANGYVQLAPRKSEFYTTPPQGGDPVDWITTLAVHEYRHVVQFDKLTGSIKFPFEELGLAFFGVALPSWFYEGDAVLTETRFTKGGRGVIPSWEMNFRANLLEDKNYSYQKDYLGSYKDITPGYYQLGYFMTTKLHRDYGDSITNRLLSRIAKNPIRPYNFSRSLKKITGYNTKQWHQQTVDELRDLWQAQSSSLSIKEYTKQAVPSSKFPTSYYYPQASDNGVIYAIKESPLRVNSIIQLKDGKETVEVVKTGRQNSPYFSYAAEQFVWNEIREDPRFKLRSYSVIHYYDLSTKRRWKITKKSRLFSPSLSKDATKIAAIEIDLKNENYLVVIDTETGNEINRIPSPGDRNLSHPSFQPDGSHILVVGRNSEGSSIIEFSLANKSSRILLDHQIQEIADPSYTGDGILFKAHYNGIDNLYLLNPETGEIRQLTSVRYGAFNPSYQAEDNKIFFSNYTGRNYEIQSLYLDTLHSRDIRDIENSFISYFKPLSDTINLPRAHSLDSTRKFQHKAYKEIAHLFNFHSISINDGEYDNLTEYKPGLFFLSNNIMNTLAVKVGGTFDPDIHALNFQTEFAYNRYYPKFSAAYHNREQLANVRHPQSKEIYPARWREHYSQFQVQFPFSINRLNYNYNINLGIASSYTHRYGINRPDFQNVLIKHIEFPLHYQVSLGRNARRAQLDLAPRWGQNISLNYRHLPFSHLTGTRLALQSTFYFPGLATNHSTQLRFNMQERSGVFAYENIIPMVSGFDQLTPTQPSNTLFLNYKLPIAYPDFDIGPLAYVKSFKANLFADFEDIGVGNQPKPRTYGVQLLADVNFFRFVLPEFELGLKGIAVNENNPKKFILQYSLSYSY
ncbi:TolB family protein [Albibacterium indicum]|uniref:TolB family protein n=1 Tax=Albibacterium indicum TaxID=2292082 RepID=UPI000E47681A|nr:hypothetical protein [Pedobacter indicus]